MCIRDRDRIEHLRGMNNRVSSLYPRFREMMESNDYAGLDQCLDVYKRQENDILAIIG